jgi:hypothetical protein
MEEINEYQTLTLLASFIYNPTNRHIINSSNIKVGEFRRLFNKVRASSSQERLSLKSIARIVGGNEKMVIVI